MHTRAVGHLLGRSLIAFAGIQLVPLAVSLAYASVDGSTGEPMAFGLTAGVSLVLGLLLIWRCSFDEQRFRHREAFGLVVVVWLAFAALGALPFTLVADPSVRLRYIDALFESTSGLTTTGASILTDIEALHHGLLFWRALCHWLGGMGIIVLAVAILPGLGAGGYQLVRFEAPGPSADRLVPRMAQTAKILWLLYAALTATQVLLLWAGEMNFFEAVCHAFATLATGGFSTRNASLGAFGAYSQWVTIAFMYLAGMNFLMHWQLLRGRPLNVWRDPEWRLYTSIILVAVALAILLLSIAPYAAADADPGAYATFGTRLRHAAFQVVSLASCTGFSTADYDGWPQFLRLMLLLLLIIGACAGSTGGGLKQIRVVVLARYAGRELRRLAQPHIVAHVKLRDEPIDRAALSGILGTLIVFLGVAVLGTLLLSLDPGADLETAFSATVTCLSGCGPGLAAVGPTRNYFWMTDFSKSVCAILMIVGRLEFYAVLLLFVPATWRR